MRLFFIKPACGFLLLVSVHAFATQPAPLQQSNMSLNLANALVEATMSACHAQGRSAVAAVIDRGGHLLSLQRDDSVGPHNTDAAVKKAFTALSSKTPSRIFAENARKNPESNNLNTIDRADSNLKCNTCNQVRFADVITSFVLVLSTTSA